ncbi:MAG: DUF6297 family protein [Arachnia sp.]
MHSAEWTAGELRSWVRAHRQGRRREWADWYHLGFAVVLVAAMGTSLISRIAVPLFSCAPGAAACLTGISLLPSLWVAATITVVGAMASLLGPLAVSVAVGSWILPLPIDRAELLAPDLRRVVVIGLAVGLLSGAALWLLTGRPSLRQRSPIGR